jgi:hypothetical protein
MRALAIREPGPIQAGPWMNENGSIRAASMIKASGMALLPYC